MSPTQQQKAQWKRPELYPRLDHVCVPTLEPSVIAPFLYNTLGARNAEGGENTDIFLGCSWYIGRHNAKLETICPASGADPKTNFLARFLKQHGTTAHHTTFLVDNIDEACEQAKRLGFKVVGYDVTTDVYWKEAFLLPKQCGGIVIQFAELTQPPAGTVASWGPHYTGFPNHCNKCHSGSQPTNVQLRGVRLRTTDKSRALHLWRDLLNGRIEQTVKQSNSVELVYIRWNHSPMYIVLEVHSGSTSVEDGFVCVEVATEDGSKLNVSNTGVKAEFRQVPISISQQNSSKL